MIDPDTEDMLPFQAAGAAILGHPHISTLHRWRLKGVRGVKLETIICGGLRYTSRQAIQRFIAAQNADQQPAPALTKSQRQMNAKNANRLLQEAGL